MNRRKDKARKALAAIVQRQARAEHEQRESVRRAHRRRGGYRAPRLDAYGALAPSRETAA